MDQVPYLRPNTKRSPHKIFHLDRQTRKGSGLELWPLALYFLHDKLRRGDRQPFP